MCHTDAVLPASHVCPLPGKFPYPFLNQLPLPQGFIVMLVLGIVIFWGFFQIGRQVNRCRTKLETYYLQGSEAVTKKRSSTKKTE